MGIEKIDKNFELRVTQEGEKVVYPIPHDSFAVYGVFYDTENTCFARMPYAVAEKVNEGVKGLSRHTSGGRLCFVTDSKNIQVRVTYDGLGLMSHMPLSGSSSFSLLEDTPQGEKFVGNFMPLWQDYKGFTAERPLPGGMRKYVLYFPLYNEVRSLSIGLDVGAVVEKYNPYVQEKPILYYGSSITQGGCANRPDHCYQALICKQNHVDYINLGFSGSARGEDVMVDYLASIDCSIFVCDYDHNAPNAEHLQKTHFSLYQRYRAVRPDTPIVFVSKPDWRNDKEGDKRWKIIRETYQKAKKLGDDNVYFVSGKSFYGNKESAVFSVDGCHPTDYGFAKMAEKIYQAIRKAKKV